MKSILLFYIVGLSAFVQAQVIQPYDMVPYRKDSLWGFADIAKTILITPQYDEIRFFKDEITAVRKNDKWGFIDKHGKAVTPLKYDLAGDFSEGMCQVRSGDAVGYVNNKGKETIKPAYQFCEEFSEGYAVVSDSVNDQLISKVIDKNGKIILAEVHTASTKFHSGYIAVEEGNKNYFINPNGKKLNLPQGAEPYFEFAENAAIVKLHASKKANDTIAPVYYLGIINTSGKLTGDTVKNVFGSKISVNASQRVIANFVNGFAIVQRSGATYADKDNEYAFIDKSGKMSMWFSVVRAFSEDGRTLVVSTADSTVRIIDTKFKTIPPEISLADAGTFSEGMLRVKFAVDGKWGYINEDGEVVVDPIFEEASDFSGGVAAVTLKGKKGFINKKGLQFWEN